jgi:4-amino-4-deoxy-L-arabinose transferase-like glycosyltransferase
MNGAAVARARVPIPPPLPVLAALCLVYLLLGLVGHDPWKTEDALGIGIVHQLLTQGHWLVPHLAGEPYLDDGPLHVWLAGLTAKVFSFGLAPHDGARMASALSVAAAIFFARLAARTLHGKSAGDYVVLVLLGCLGLLVHAHETLSESTMLAGLALSWYGMALFAGRPEEHSIAPPPAAWSGVILGAGLAIALLAKGAMAALPPVLTLLLLPLVSEKFRNRAFLANAALGMAIGAGCLAVWLAAVHWFYPGLAGAWISAQLNIWSWPDTESAGYYAKLLSWSSWPAWPLAVWFFWDNRRKPARPGVRLLMVALAVTIAVLLTTRDMRPVNALAVLLPLALLAAAGAGTLRRGAANALAWFGAMSFTFFGFLVWLGWFAMLTGAPGTIARNFAKLEPGHVQRFETLAVVVAAVVTLCWLYVLVRTERSALRSVAFWAVGITFLWGLLMTLWLSWIDHGKSYALVARSLQQTVQTKKGCIESMGLGEAQRAALDYHAGIVTRRVEIHGRGRCPLLLTQTSVRDERPPERGWTKVWEGSRPRERERYRLYQRNR